MVFFVKISPKEPDFFVLNALRLSLFVAGLTLTAQSLGIVVREIFDYPVVTTSVLQTQSSVAFPGVTVCNLNRVGCHQLFLRARRAGAGARASGWQDEERK